MVHLNTKKAYINKSFQDCVFLQGAQGDEGNPGDKGDVVSCYTIIRITVQHINNIHLADFVLFSLSLELLHYRVMQENPALKER